MISTADKEIVKKGVLPSEPEKWHVDLALIRNKNNSTIKKIVTILENFEDHKRKLDIQNRNGFYKNYKYNGHSENNSNWKDKNKGKITCRTPGYDHE